MRSWKKPTPEQVNKAITLLVYAEHYRYFFDRLENPEWLEPLWERGFFRNPPEPERNEEEGTVRFPPWPEAKYLVRMAKYKAELVAQIIQEMPDTDNPAVLVDLIGALLTMPPDVAELLLEKVLRWAETPHLLFLDRLGSLIAYFAGKGRLDTAMEIAGVFLDVLPDNKHQMDDLEDSHSSLSKSRARFDSRYYEQILKKYYPALVETAGVPALELLCQLLEKAIRFSRTEEEEDNPNDASPRWRPAIEDSPQNFERTIKSVLVVGIRDAGELLVREQKAHLQEVIETLEARRYKVFRRIALHLLRLFAAQGMDMIMEKLTDQSNFEDIHLQHEYVLLMRECFACLTPEAQQMILAWIEVGPNDIEDFRQRAVQVKGVPPSEEEITHYHERWQRDRLAWIGEDSLPKTWQERYRVLVEKYGEADHPEFPVYSEFSWEGPSSPKSIEELKALSVEEIVNFLKTWIPPKTIFDEPSREGLGRVLSGVVAEEPERFASKAHIFSGIDPTYIRSLLSGLRESLEKEKTFAWDPVIDLCRWVVEQPREIQGRRVSSMEADVDWGPTRQTIAHLLSDGFRNGVGSIPFELREQVWEVLYLLTKDPDPTPAHEERYGGFNMNPAMLSINTVRGAAMHAVIRYALWVWRYTEEASTSEVTTEYGFAKMPEIREVLETHLDVTKDPSLAVRSVYGQWFPWIVLLDNEWARHNVGRIFPLDLQEQAYFQAAWNTYVMFCKPYDNVFPLLREQYQYAVEHIGIGQIELSPFHNSDAKLAEHLMALYWRGKLNIDNSMLILFWKKAPDQLRAHAMSFVGRALINTPEEIPSEVLERFKVLWKERLAVAQQAKENHEKEMAAFGWWFTSKKFEPSWSLAQMNKALKISGEVEQDDLVIEMLVELVDDFPEEVVGCLELIVRGDRDGWKIYHLRKPIRQILTKALRAVHASEKAERIVHYLGSRGFLEFRDLI